MIPAPSGVRHAGCALGTGSPLRVCTHGRVRLSGSGQRGSRLKLAAGVLGVAVATLTLLAAGAIGPGDLWLRWSTGWLGETTGALLVAPLLVAWRTQPRQMPGRRLWVTVPVVLAGALVMVLFARASRWEQSRL